MQAAAEQLMKVGPEGLRLAELAEQLQISHPAILHHFGSREGLVAAVLHHLLQTLRDQLTDALRNGGADRNELVEMVASVCASVGLAGCLRGCFCPGARTSYWPRSINR
jgi:AcrR family transcriptional regulator